MKTRRATSLSKKTNGIVLKAEGRPLLGGLALLYLGDQYYEQGESDVVINRGAPIFGSSQAVTLVDDQSIDRFSREAGYLINSSFRGSDDTVYSAAGSGAALLSASDFGLLFAANELAITNLGGESVEAVEQNRDASQTTESTDSESAFSGDSLRSSAKAEDPADSLAENEAECVAPEAENAEKVEGGDEDVSTREGCEPEIVEECVADPSSESAESCDPESDTSNLIAGAGAGGGAGLGLAGGGGSLAVGGSSVSVTVSGAVIDGYVDGAFVFADINGNGIYDSGEPSTYTDENGAYEFTSSVSMDGVSIMSMGGVDVDTGAEVDFLVAPSGMTYVTPVSSIVYYGQEAGTDASSIMSGLGFSYDDLFIDPVAAYNAGEDDGGLLVAGASLLTAVSAGAALVSNATGETAAESAKAVFEQLAQQGSDALQSFIADGVSTTDSTTVLTTVLTNTLAAKSMAIDTLTITKTASSIGNVVDQLRNSKTADGSIDVSAAQVFANIGQTVLKLDLKDIGEAIKNGEDVSGLISGIQETYGDPDRLQALKNAQQSVMEARKAGVEGLTLNKDIFSLTIDPDAETGGDIVGYKRPSDADIVPVNVADVTSIPSVPLTELLANDLSELEGVDLETGQGLTFTVSAISPTSADDPNVLMGGISFSFNGGNLSTDTFLTNLPVSGFTLSDQLVLIDETVVVAEDGTESNADPLPVVTDGAGRLALEIGVDVAGQAIYHFLYQDGNGSVLTVEDFTDGKVNIDQVFVEDASNQFTKLTDWFAANSASQFFLVEGGGLVDDADVNADGSVNDVVDVYRDDTGNYALQVGTDKYSNPIFEQVYAGNMGESLTEEQVLSKSVRLSETFVMRTDPDSSPEFSLGVAPDFNPLLASSYGDYYFSYKVRVDATGEVAMGHFTVQVSPEAEFTLSPASVQEAVRVNYSTIKLSELITLDTFGPGDKLSIEGLPQGSNITGFFDANGDGIADIDDLLIQQNSDFPMMIPAQYLLGTRFPSLELNIPGNVSGTLDVKITLSSRYGSASSTTTKSVELSVLPSVDGLKNVTALTNDITNQVGNDRVFEEDKSASLFSEGAAFEYLTRALDADSQLALYDTDGSEGLAVAIGLPDGWEFSGEVSPIVDGELSALDGSVSWYVFVDQSAPELSLVEQLKSLKLVPPDDFYGAFEIVATLGAFERADLTTLGFDSQTFKVLSDVVLAKPEQLVLVESLPNYTNEQSIADGDDSYAVFSDTISYIAKNFFDFLATPGVEESSGSEFVQINVQIPDLFFVLPNTNPAKDSWVAIGSGDPGSTIYQVSDVTIKDLYDSKIADLVLKPISGQASDPDVGSQIKVSGFSYVDRSSLDDAVDFATASGEASVGSNTFVAPNLDASGDVSAKASVMVLSESQEEASDWRPVEDFIQVNSLTDDGASETFLKIIVDGVAGKPVLEFAQSVSGVVDATVEYKLDPVSNRYVYEIPVTANSLPELLVRGYPFLHSNAFSADISVVTTQTWGGQTVTAESVSTEIFGRVDAVATDLSTAAVVESSLVGTEDVAISLSQFVDTAAILGDPDGSETLYYEVRLPATVFLIDSTGARVGSRLDSGTGEKIFEILAEDVNAYSVKGSAHFSGADLPFSILAIAEDVNGTRSFSTDQDGEPVPSVGVFSFTPVSDAPTVSLPSDLTKLLPDASTSLSIPIVVNKKDTSESVDVVITIDTKDGSSIDGLEFSTSVGSLELTGNQLIIPSARVPELSTLKVRSTVDYRGDNALTLTVDAGSTDSGASRAPYEVDLGTGPELPQIVVELYKPVGVPGLSVTKIAPAGPLAFPELVIDVGLPDTPADLGTNSVALLVIGVPGDSYFLSNGAPVGANLGDGIWLLTETETTPLFSQDGLNLQATLEIRGTDGSTFQVKALVTDATGGTSSSSVGDKDDSVTIDDPLTDPVVAVFGSTEPTIINQVVEFDLAVPEPTIPGTPLSQATIDTEPRLEYLHSWMIGDASSIDGTAFFVKGPVDGPTIEDLFEDLDSLFDYADGYVDGNPNGTLTFDELAAAGIHLWFDGESTGVRGQVDQGELLSIETSFDTFEIDRSTVIVDEQPVVFGGQETADVGTQIERFSTGSFSYSLADTSDVLTAALYETGIPYSSFAASNTPVSTVRVSSSDGTGVFKEDVPIDVVISFSPMDTSMLPQPTIVNLVKVFGVPDNAVLNGAVYVEAEDPSSQDFWIVTMPDADENNLVEDVSLTLRFTEDHVIETVSLSVEPLVSVTDVDGSVYETVFGQVDTATPIVLSPVAETELLIERTSEAELTMSEGGKLLLGNIVSISSPDDRESLSVRVELTDIEGNTIDPSSILTGNYTAIDESTVEMSFADLSSVLINLPPFYSSDFEITLTPVSTDTGTDGLGTDTFVDSTNTISIPVSVTPVADGIDTLGIQVTDENGIERDSVTEGESIFVDIGGSAIDPSESLSFLVEIGGSGEAVTAIQSFGGQRLVNKTSDQMFWSVELDEDDISGPLEIMLDPYFDGNIDVNVSAYSIEPTTGQSSVVSAKQTTTASVIAAPGNSVEAPSFAVAVLNSNGRQFEQLQLREGETEAIAVRVTSFDAGETFVLLDGAGNRITDPEPETLDNGARIFTLPLTIESPNKDLKEITGLSLEVEESGLVQPVSLPKIEVTVEKTATIPIFEGLVSEIRVELSEGSLLGEAVELPDVVEDGSDDVLHFELTKRGLDDGTVADLPAQVLLDRGSLIARGGLNQENKAYHLTSAQFASGFTITALTGLFGQTAEAQMLVWEAIHTEATTGEQARSSSIGINLTQKVALEGQRIDELTNDWIVLEGSVNTLTLNGGVGEDQFDTAVSGSNIILNVDSESTDTAGRNIEMVVGSDSVFDSMMEPTTLTLSYETAALGGAQGAFDFSVTVIPAIGTAGFDFGTAFGDGYLAAVLDSSTWTNSYIGTNDSPAWFAQVNSDTDQFSFIDPTSEFVVIDPGLIGIYGDDNGTADIDESMIVGFGNLSGEFTAQDLDDSGDISMVRIHGTEANDLIMADADAASILFGAGGTNEIYGSSGDDLIIVGHEADFIHSQGGNDVIQIATDASYNEANMGAMEGLLDAILGEPSAQLFAELEAIHAKAFAGDGINPETLSFKGLVTDYNREEGEADRLVFSNGSSERDLTVEGYDLATTATWGGESNYIYAIARSVDTIDTGGTGSENYFSMILMSDYAANSDEGLIIDLEAAGIIAT